MHYTNHAISQFKARFPHLVKEGESAKVALHQVFVDSKKEGSFKNNTALMAYMVERYGDSDCDFYVNKKEHVIFIIRNREMVITVVSGLTPNSVYSTKRASGFRKKF